MKKRVAYILTNYSLKPDGISIYSENILSELKNKKIEIDIYILKKHKYFLLERFNLFGISNYDNFRFKQINLSMRIAIYFYLNIVLNIKKYDFVIFPSLLPVIVLRNKSIKVIHDYTYRKYKKSLSILQIIYKQILQYFLIFENYIGYISNTTLKDISNFGNYFIKRKKKIYLPNGLPLLFSHQIDNIKKNQELTLLYLGSKNFHKGFDNSLKLVNFIQRKFPNKKITAYFVGKEKFDTQKIIDKTDLNNSVNFIFLDYVNNDTVIELYSKSHFLLFLSKNEGFGLPILEAINYQCVPILSDLEIFREILNIKNYSLFFKDSNFNEISKNIQNLINNEKLNQSLLKLLNDVLDKNKNNFKICSKNLIDLI